MIKDRFRFSKRIDGASKIKNESVRNAVFDEIALDIAQSMMVVEQRKQQMPKIEYPALLPVSQNVMILRMRLQSIRSSLLPVKLAQAKPLSYRKFAQN